MPSKNKDGQSNWRASLTGVGLLTRSAEYSLSAFLKERNDDGDNHDKREKPVDASCSA